MIPALLLIGLAIGCLPHLLRRLAALAIAAVSWSALLVATGTVEPTDAAGILGALVLAAANAAVGVYLGSKLAAIARPSR